MSDKTQIHATVPSPRAVIAEALRNASGTGESCEMKARLVMEALDRSGFRVFQEVPSGMDERTSRSEGDADESKEPTALLTDTPDIRSADLNRMCLPHHLAGMDNGDICNAARWAQGKIQRLELALERVARRYPCSTIADMRRVAAEAIGLPAPTGNND